MTTISLGGIPEILAAMRAGAVNGGILSPPTSTAARDLGYRPLCIFPIWARNSPSPVSRPNVPLSKINRKSPAPLWRRSPTARRFIKKTAGRRWVLRKYMRADDRTLEGGYKEYDAAISSPPYPSLKGLEAVRDSLLESTPQLKNVDLRKFIDDRFVKAK